MKSAIPAPKRLIVVCAMLIALVLVWLAWPHAGQRADGQGDATSVAAPAAPVSVPPPAPAIAPRPAVPSAALARAIPPASLASIQTNTAPVTAPVRAEPSETVAEEDRAGAAGETLRVRIVRDDSFKYPLIRREETLRADPKGGAATVVSRRAMVADHVVVILQPGKTPEDLRVILNSLGATVRRVMPLSGSVLVAFDGTVPAHFDRVLNGILAEKALVASASPDQIVQALETLPDDPMFGQLWGLRNTGQIGGTPGADISAAKAWDLATGRSNIVVGVIDTGIDYTHPDLAGNIWRNAGETGTDGLGADKRTNGIDDDGNGYVDDWQGWNFVANTNDPKDDHFHGSHCAGTIGAAGNNAAGVAGVNWTVRLMPLKFLNASGSGALSDAAEAIWYATRMGAKLTSNSWGSRGGGGYDAGIEAAVRNADTNGCLFVIAAGNDGLNHDITRYYPADLNLSNIVCVAATDRRDQLASFSCFSSNFVHVGAPGVDIVSTVPNGGYRTLSGTSMATPHVAGALALMWSVDPGASSKWIRQQLLDNVDPVPALQGRTKTGGRINVERALGSRTAALAVAETAVNDALGNNDGYANAGERVALRPRIRNYGFVAATNVTATLIGADGYVTVLTNTHAIGTIQSRTSVWDTAGFPLAVASNCPAGHKATWTLTLAALGGQSWTQAVAMWVWNSSTVSGQVTDLEATNAPLPGATVSYQGPVSGSGVTDSNGLYRLSPLIDGTYTIKAAYPGRASETRQVTVPPDRAAVNLALGDPDLTGLPAAIEWSVPQGQTVLKTLSLGNSGSSLLVCDFSSDQAWMTLSAPSVQLPPGQSTNLTVELVPLALGVYRATLTAIANDPDLATASVPVTVRAEAAPVMALAEVVVDDSAGGDGDGWLEAGEDAILRVRLRNAGEGAGADIRAVLSDDVYVQVTGDREAVYGAVPAGAATLGAFVVHVPTHAPSGHDARLALSVTDNSGLNWDLALSFRLARYATMSGAVQGPLGEPVSNALVRAFGPGSFEGRSDASGAFRLTGLTAGRYAVSALRADFARSPSLTVDTPPDVSGLLLTIDPGLKTGPAWGCGGGNARRDGRGPGVGGREYVEKFWLPYGTSPSNAYYSARCDQVVVGGSGAIFMNVSRKGIVSLNPDTLTTNWIYQESNPDVNWNYPNTAPYHSPVLGLDESVFLLSGGDTTSITVRAISPGGALRWTRQFTGTLLGGGQFVSGYAAVSPSGVLTFGYAAGQVCRVVGLDPASGSTVFERQWVELAAQPWAFVGFAIDDDGLIYVTHPFFIEILDSAGQFAGSIAVPPQYAGVGALGNGGLSGCPVIGPEQVYVFQGRNSAPNSRLMAFDKRERALVWTRDFPAETCWSSRMKLAVGQDDSSLFVGLEERYGGELDPSPDVNQRIPPAIHALDRRTGDLFWKVNVTNYLGGRTRLRSLLVDRNNTLFVSTDEPAYSGFTSGYARAYDGATGRELWLSPTNGAWGGQTVLMNYFLAMGPDGTLYYPYASWFGDALRAIRGSTNQIAGVCPTVRPFLSVTTVAAGEPVHFSDGGSVAPGGQIVKWWWDVGEDDVPLAGRLLNTTATLGTFDFSYPRPGRFRATLYVQSDVGLVGTASVDVTVTGVARDVQLDAADAVTVYCGGEFGSFWDGTLALGTHYAASRAASSVSAINFSISYVKFDLGALGDCALVGKAVLRLPNTGYNGLTPRIQVYAMADDDWRATDLNYYTVRHLDFLGTRRVTDVGTALTPLMERLSLGTETWLDCDLTAAIRAHTNRQFSLVIYVPDPPQSIYNASSAYEFGKPTLWVQTRSLTASPTVSVAAPRHAAAGSPVPFAASIVDGDGSLVSARWTFGDGAAVDAAATRGVTNHVFAAPGLYRNALVARDSNGHEIESEAVEIAVHGTNAAALTVPPAVDGYVDGAFSDPTLVPNRIFAAPIHTFGPLLLAGMAFDSPTSWAALSKLATYLKFENGFLPPNRRTVGGTLRLRLTQYQGTGSTTLKLYGLSNTNFTARTLRAWGSDGIMPNYDPASNRVTGVGLTAFLLATNTISAGSIGTLSFDVGDYLRAHDRQTVAFLLVNETTSTNSVAIMGSSRGAQSAPALELTVEEVPLWTLIVAKAGNGSVSPAAGSYPIPVGDSTNVVATADEWHRVQSLTTNAVAIAAADGVKGYTQSVASLTANLTNTVAVTFTQPATMGGPFGTVPTAWLSQWGTEAYVRDNLHTNDYNVGTKYLLNVDPTTNETVAFRMDALAVSGAEVAVVAKLLVNEAVHRTLYGTVRLYGCDVLSNDCWAAAPLIASTNVPPPGAVFDAEGKVTFTFSVGPATNRFYQGRIE